MEKIGLGIMCYLRERGKARYSDKWCRVDECKREENRSLVGQLYGKRFMVNPSRFSSSLD
jgi:hypothetical protein